MKVLTSTKGMSREEWLEWRRKGIGGSDASAVAGFNRYRSPMAVWMEKTGQFEEDPPGEAAYWGTVLEDVVAAEFENRTGLELIKPEIMYQHPEHDFMLANIDRFIQSPDKETPGVLEVKTASAYKLNEWDGDRIPDEYMIQIQHYMAVLGCTWGYFAVLIGGNTFIYKPVERNEAMIQSLIKLEKEFWEEYVIGGGAPPMDGSDASVNLLNHLYPDAVQASEMELNSEQYGLIELLEQAKDAEKVAKEVVRLYENQLKDAMKDHEIALFRGDSVVTWKNTNRTTVDSKRLKQEQPDIYDKYSTVSTSRRFIVK